MLLKALALLTVFGLVAGQRPSDTSICDYYASALLGGKNTAASQLKLMLLITHTFILGNYTMPNVGVKVAGIAAPGNFDGIEVNLLPYFTGGYASTNLGGPQGVAKNFLDDGGATALLANKPADTTMSNQYALLTHVYQYFGIFFGCSKQGGSEFPGYQGRASQYTVHKYMDLDKYELGYFIEQTSLAVQSLGFYEADVDFVRVSLETVFNRRCSPAATVIPPSAGPQLQAICIAENCLLDPMPMCSAYPNNGVGVVAAIANATLVGSVTKAGAEPTASSTSGSGTSAASSSPSAAVSSGGAEKIVAHAAAVAAAAVFAFAV